MSGKRKRLKNKENSGLLFIMPFFLVFVVFGLYPILYTFYFSFQQWDGLMPPVAAGLKNFQRVD